MSKYTGIDISKETFDAAFLTEDGLIRHAKFANTEIGFKQLFKQLSPDEHVIMEASGTYYLALATYLFNNGIRVSVVNPLSVRRFCQMKMARAKTDKKDALMIALYGKQEEPEAWEPEAEAVTKLRQLTTVIEQLDKQITALKNQLEALSRMPVVEPSVLKSIRRLIAQLEKEKEQLEKKAQQVVKQNYAQSYQALTTIPGIGPKSATMLIMITGNFTRFDTYKQLVSYVGLSPRVYQSGTSVKGRGHICKMGMGLIRKVLYMCSWSAKRFNAQCKETWQRLSAKGKPEKVIKIALANKLLRQAFAIATKLSAYDKNYQPKFAF